MSDFDDEIRKAQELYDDYDNLIDEVLIESADRCVAIAQPNTPVKTGNLKRSIHREEPQGHKSITVTTKGMGVHDYASRIEEGFTGSKGGVYIGQHMVQNAIDIVEDEMEDIFDEKVRKYFD